MPACRRDDKPNPATPEGHSRKRWGRRVPHGEHTILTQRVVRGPGAKANVRSEERLVDIQGLAAYLRMAKDTLYTWVSQRRIPHFKLGNRLRFDLDEIDHWLEKQAVRPLGVAPRPSREYEGPSELEDPPGKEV